VTHFGAGLFPLLFQEPCLMVDLRDHGEGLVPGSCCGDTCDCSVGAVVHF
jgi:hypothetical protein